MLLVAEGPRLNGFSSSLFPVYLFLSMARGAVFEKALVRISVFHKHGIG